MPVEWAFDWITSFFSCQQSISTKVMNSHLLQSNKTACICIFCWKIDYLVGKKLSVALNTKQTNYLHCSCSQTDKLSLSWSQNDDLLLFPWFALHIKDGFVHSFATCKCIRLSGDLFWSQRVILQRDINAVQNVQHSIVFFLPLAAHTSLRKSPNRTFDTK